MEIKKHCLHVAVHSPRTLLLTCYHWSIKGPESQVTLVNSVVFLFLFLQHVLIVVKMILAFVIPDEPEWVQIKKQQIEYRTILALKEQVKCGITAPQYNALHTYSCP